MAGIRKCYYLNKEEADWVRDVAEINARKESAIISIAIKLLREKLEDQEARYDEAEAH